jgi:hypothetical protein
MTKSKKTILDRVTRDFAFRVCPAGADPDRHADREHVRSILGSAAIDLARIVPESRELNHALNKLDEAVHWAHDAIDRYGQNSPEVSE